MARKRGKQGDGDDGAVWDHVARSVTPLPGRRASGSSVAADHPKVRSPRGGAAAAKAKVAPPPRKAVDLDRRTEEKFRGGEMKIAARLDLHGLKQDDAYAALVPFIAASYGAGRRCVLIITGKGRGVLKTRVPHWLSDPAIAGMVLRVAPAQPRHGGDGALYVLLRRIRD